MKDLYFSQIDDVPGRSKIAMDSMFLLKYRPWEIGAVATKDIRTPSLNLNYDEVNKILTVIFAVYSYEPMVFLKDLYSIVYEVEKYSNAILGNAYVPGSDENGLFIFTLSNIIINPGSVIMVKSNVFDMYMDKKMSFTNVVTVV